MIFLLLNRTEHVQKWFFLEEEEERICYFHYNNLCYNGKYICI